MLASEELKALLAETRFRVNLKCLSTHTVQLSFQFPTQEDADNMHELLLAQLRLGRLDLSFKK